MMTDCEPRACRATICAAATFVCISMSAMPNHASAQCQQHWESLGTGVNSVIRVFLPWDQDGPGGNPPVLVAGGWSGLNSQMNFGVAALEVFDEDGVGPALPVLFAGGNFTTAGGVTVNQITRWDGKNWSALANGTNSLVSALTVFDHDGAGPETGALIAGGFFNAPTNHIGRGRAFACRAMWIATARSTLII